MPEWLAKPDHVRTRMQQHTVDYWLGMYWATPPWLSDLDVMTMKAIYNDCDPAFHHVDHIVPLHHPLVCGLNVPWNVQKLDWRANLSKSNHYWPDCPDHLCPIRNLPVDMFGFNDEPLQLGLGL